MRLKAHGALLLASLLWVSAFVLIRTTVTVFSPGALALLRYDIASICMLGFYYRRDRRNVLRGRSFVWVMCTGVIGIGIYNIALNYAERSVTSGTASFVIAFIPIFAAILAYVFLNERLRKLGWLGLLLSFSGITIMFLPDLRHAEFNTGLGLLLISALVGALFSILQKPLLLKAVHPFELISVAVWGATLLLLLLYGHELWQQIFVVPHRAIIEVTFLGIFPAAFAYALWSYGIRAIPVTIATSYLYLMPPLTILLAWFTLGEFPNEFAIWGGIIALIGTVTVNLNSKKDVQHGREQNTQLAKPQSR